MTRRPSMLALRKPGPEPGELALQEVARPEPSPGQVVVEVHGAGICGTDLHIMEGEYPSEPPVTLGHEVAGVVVRAGTPDSPWVGARVGVESFFSTDDTCPMCRAGRRNLCPERRSIGSFEDGGFAPEVLVPVRNLHRLPDALDLHAAALLEPLGCVVNCLLDPPRINAGDRVLVTGPGTLGLLAAQVARSCGGQVTVVGTSRDGARLAVARDLGFEARTVEESIGDVERAIECSGSAAGLTLCLERLLPGGHLVQIGLFGRPVSVPLDLLCSKGLSCSSDIAAPASAWQRALALVASGAVELDALITEVVPLRDWRRAFDSSRTADGLKYVIDPQLPGDAPLRPS
ncbi:alcohol dehydrogenase catalytic domain-containing protein [Pimelobacter simplex]|uniref:alcohol dehydrogenase catalytic domain-containing protein n=1 Tax=Nocardioides simplex TaxID=2045 RepID=UPI003810A3A4